MIVLTVAWLDISAKRAADRVLVNWSVASQFNNQRFEVQRSVDGVHFVTVGVIPGEGTKRSYAEYEYTDYTAEKGTLYYRVVQYDVDGASSSSRVVTAELANKAVNNLLLYPNPTSSLFTLSLTSDAELAGSALVQVLNTLGQEVHAVAVDASQLASGVSIDAGVYPQGTYLVKVITSEGEWIKQLIKR
jgi:hypothetical protein